MISSPPSFMSDWRRFSFVVAIRKRVGRFQGSGERYTYGAIVAMDSQTAMALLDSAGVCHELCGCLAYESLSISANGKFAALWTGIMAMLAAKPEATGVAMLSVLIRRYEEDDDLKSLTLDATGNYLLGRVYSNLAFAAKGKSKSDLQKNKKLALHYLGQARAKCQAPEAGDAAPDPYRQAAIAAALVASVATAYEAAAYLQWKGTGSVAISE